MKYVRKVQEEGARSPDCAHGWRRGLPGEEHQVCPDDNDDDDNDDVRYNEEDIREWFR